MRAFLWLPLTFIAMCSAEAVLAQCDPDDLICRSLPYSRPSDPSAVVHKLYEQCTKLDLESGLPSAEQLKEIRPLISHRLASLLARARQAEEENIRKTPEGDKPMLIEGDIFTGGGRSAEKVTVLDEYPIGSYQIVTIKGEHRDSHNRLNYSLDQVYLAKNEQGQWVVDNIDYHGGGDLVHRLDEFTQQK